MKKLMLLACCALLAAPAAGDEDASQAKAHLSQFGKGAGPVHQEGVWRLLDAAGTFGQSNAVAFDCAKTGAHERVTLRCQMRVGEGGDGGAFVFLDTGEYGLRGPAPYVSSWTEPNLRKTFAVGIDVHDPPSKEQFSPWGNYENRPQREVSLHFDGREIVKRVAPAEFRGEFAPVRIVLQHVPGGAEVTVEIADAAVFEREFVADLQPYELRLALGAGTREDVATTFDVKELSLRAAVEAKPRRDSIRFELFNHVLTNSKQTAFETEVTLPPAGWSFGRVVMTIEIHDAGEDWDEWDRNGEVSVWDDEGVKRGIVPFITSYRTPCRWKVDVTHFRPYLAGKRRIEIQAGTTFYKNRGFMMSAALEFHHGAPALEPYSVTPLWVGQAQYRSAENHYQDFFTPQRVRIDPRAKAARVFLTTTGHSQVGEFTPSKRTVVFRPDRREPAEQRFENVLWKTDVYLNPNRPQAGTWQYARAGWAPGDYVRPWWIDLTPDLRPGVEAELRYEPQPYEFPADAKPSDADVAQANQVVRSYLILYREVGDTTAAPTLRIVEVKRGSNAAKAGMQPEDYLAMYDAKAVRSIEELRTAMKEAIESGQRKIRVVVYRGAERMELEVEPGTMGVSLAR